MCVIIHNKNVMKDYPNDGAVLIEDCQKTVARILAVNPAGRGLFLIGGFRYRFIDHSSRRSLDIDYHWGGVLADKQREVISLFKRKLVPELKRRYRLDAQVYSGRAMEKQSEQVKVIEVVVSRSGDPPLRAEIDVDITAVELADPPEVRTADGVIYPTVSDADMIESKVVSIFSRVYLQVRDLLDLFLFRDALRPDSPARIRSKLSRQGIGPERMLRQVRRIEENRALHLRDLDQVIEEQVDRPAAENIRLGGGAAGIFQSVTAILKEVSR